MARDVPARIRIECHADAHTLPMRAYQVVDLDTGELMPHVLGVEITILRTQVFAMISIPGTGDSERGQDPVRRIRYDWPDVDIQIAALTGMGD